jgi:hypothetical protein
MPTSTRRQAASRSTRYSELNNALSSLHADGGSISTLLPEGAGQHEVHEDEDEENAFDGDTISVGDTVDDEPFEGDGKCDMRPETYTSD